MTLAEFKDTLRGDAPPPGSGSLLAALWREGRGEWDAAHRIVQEESGAGAAWVHAYLHRREGDASNAAYWYRRAGRTPPTGTLEAEWDEIATALLAAGPGASSPG